MSLVAAPQGQSTHSNFLRSGLKSFIYPLEMVVRQLWRKRRWDVSEAEEGANEIASLKQNMCPHLCTQSTLDYRRLPVELWWDILQFAIEPSFATEVSFLSQDIQFYYSALVIHHFSNPANAQAKRLRATLRLVSQDFKAIVEKALQNYYRSPSWIASFSSDVAHQYWPAVRIDLRQQLWFSAQADPIKIYKHETKIVSIRTPFPSDGPLNSIHEKTQHFATLLARPWALQVLNISILDHREYHQRLEIEILNGLPLLHTFSLVSSRPLNLGGYLAMPQIKTLFLSFEISGNGDISQWSFPSLINLSIDTRSWPTYNHPILLSVDFVDLLTRHRNTLQSLRLFPCRGSNSSSQSMPAILRSMPRLKALATDFAKYAPFSRHSSILDQAVDLWPNTTTLFGSVTNIIHISTHSYNSHLLSSILIESLGSTPHLETLAIMDEPFLQTVAGYGLERTRKECVNGLQILDELCRARNIKIIGEMGVERCCIMDAWGRLSSVEMPPEMEILPGA